MAVKLSASNLSKKIPVWVYQSLYLSSLSCANSVQIPRETDRNSPNVSEFQTKIQLLRNKLLPDTLINVIDSTADLESSLKLFKWASLQKGFRHTADTYYRIILKLGVAGKIEEVEGFCNELMREKCPGFEEALVALIDAFVRNHRLSEALCIVSCLHFCGSKPSISVYNQLMDALVKAKKDFKDVVYVYKEMVKGGIVPNTDTLNYLLEALLEADRVDSMLDQYRRMDRKGCKPNSRTFEIVLSGLVARDRVGESLVVLDQMFKSGSELDLSFYTSIVPVFCEMNELEVARRLFAMMRSSKISPNSSIYESMIRCLCENFLMDDAVQLVEEMICSHLVPNECVLASIIDRLCETNKLGEAKKFLDGFNVVSASPYNVLLEAYVNAGDFLAAKDLFGEMFEKDATDVRSWNIVIRYLCENERMNDAVKYLGKMIVSSATPDAATYSALIIGKCLSDGYEDALTLFRKVRAESWVLDHESYGQLVECLCRWKRGQEAAEVFSLMASKRRALKSISFDMLMKGICDCGNTARAIKLLSLAYYSGTPVLTVTFNSIIRGLSKQSEVDHLLVMLARMTVEGCTLDEETYCVIIESMGLLGRSEDCVLLLNSMLNEGLSPNPGTLANLLSYLTRNSQLHMILPVVDKLVSKFGMCDSSAYNVLIKSLWSGGYRSKACRLLDLMLEKGWVPDAVTHAVIMGSVEKDTEICVCDDKVSSILAEGLAEF
ncbi:PREDICTED: pentatricopeptide repeat-containing protein At1g62670, mitochondrial-like [Ipomoea nil]|uniref:pentatricopeptide repeat-containing protein At1g62670, mitochondrial-like n=1 Tax=Ipomoea nil TaxID=35883 RepID=UPI000900EF7A|nr:PREDICTED: pentatricopeptide repeat-containing protein At1g62670, mitochondrial-like [Ipomoea nil]XP_019187246.1 PREDICTED: pentatricopeptide repeat-containing protein At1g62670, mitochondrial-like [Ipomoea nil]